jgi:hypothetical protein
MDVAAQLKSSASDLPAMVQNIEIVPSVENAYFSIHLIVTIVPGGFFVLSITRLASIYRTIAGMICGAANPTRENIKGVNILGNSIVNLQNAVCKFSRISR